MRIVSVNYAFPSVSETFVLNQMTGLIDRGHEVIPWSQSEGDWERAHADVARYGLQDSVVVASRGGGVLRLWLRLAITRPSRALRILRGRKRIKRRGGTEAMRVALTLGAIRNVDLYHCQFGPMGDFTLWFREQCFIDLKPVVTTFHGWDIREALAGNLNYHALKRCDDPIVAISSYSVEQLRTLGFAAERLVRIPVAVNTERFRVERKKTIEAGPPNVVMVARFDPIKNIRMALEGLAGCRDLSFRFTLVGGGPLEADVQQWVRELGLENFVTLTGFLEQDAVATQLEQADIFVLTSDAENLPVAVMEAAACGVPVVATRVGSVTELVLDDETGLLVDAGDVDAFAKALRRLLTDTDLRREFGRKASQHITDNFSHNEWIVELERCFQAARNTMASGRKSA